jgi:pantetheine-phosphate adenylyltransferase
VVLENGPLYGDPNTMIAIYAGSLDPITYGHFDVILRAARIFDEVVVGIGTNGSKNSLFIPGERQELARAVCSEIGNVRVEIFKDLLVTFCKREGADIIVRGFRAVSDFEYELGVAHVNGQLDPNIETVFLPTKPKYSFISSSTVKDIASHGGPLDYYVHPIVATALRKKFGCTSSYPTAVPKTNG